MNFDKVFSALMQHIVDGAFGLDLRVPNKDSDTAGNEPHIIVKFNPATNSAASVGTSGMDQFEGFLELELRYPTDTGIGTALELATTISKYCKAGTRPVYNGQDVILRGCEIAPPLNAGGWLGLPVIINFSAFARRDT